MEPDSSVAGLPFKRLAITVPPGDWFHGIPRTLFGMYRQALVDLGFTVFDVPVEAFLTPDAGLLYALRSELEAFQPDLAFGLPLGSYALICRFPPRRDGWRPNLFTDVLDIPTICLWDHAPMELADQLLTPHPADSAASSSGALESLRRVLAHPRLIHWSRDSGQTRIMQDLGLLLPNQLIHQLPPALPGFLPLEAGHSDPGGCEPRVGFVGHFYQEPPHFPDPILKALADEAIRAWILARGQPLWDVLTQQISAMPPSVRERFALDPDQTYFWWFAHQLIVHQAQTASRLQVLGAAGVPVTCYGNLRTDLPGVPQNLLAAPGNVPFGPPLARLFARHSITIDVMNPGFVHGISHKPLLGFAAGGFMLIDRKRDFIHAFGEAGEAVSYSSADELGAKVDQFLSNPKYRREVGDAIRERIRDHFQLGDVLLRVVRAAAQCARPAGLNPIRERFTTVMDLLPSLRSQPEWSGASVQHLDRRALVTTAPQAWTYAAVLDIPPIASQMHEPHLRIFILVETGRIGVSAVVEETGALLAEQLVSPTSRPVTVTVELPVEGAAIVMLRNTVETASRALVLEASLCDRMTA
jgi:hypothetical protein